MFLSDKFSVFMVIIIFQVISEFDKPGSFQPMKDKYSKQKFEPTTEKSFVNGPPLGI